MSPRVPPNDLRAERALLGIAMLDRDALDRVAGIIEPDDWYSESHRLIWDAIQSVTGRGQTPDTITIRGVLEQARNLQRVGGDEYLLGLTSEIISGANAETYARTIVERATVRRLIAACAEIAAAGYAPIERVDDYVASAESKIYAACAPRNAQREGDSIGVVAARVAAKIDHARANGVTLLGRPTGFAQLDRITTGFHPGDLIIVAGRPGMGKSALAGTFATRTAYDALPVAAFSLEMPAEQWAQRSLASHGRIDATRLRSAQMSNSDADRMHAAVADLRKLPIHIDDTPGLTLGQLRSKARRVRKRYGGLGMIVVDYLQLMRSGLDHDSREQEVAEISRTLKVIAKEFEIPVIALAQLNRGIEQRSGKERRPQLSDLRESGAIEQDADTVLFVHRPEVYERNDENEGIAEILVGKQRNGVSGVTVKTRFFREHTRFEALAEYEQEELSV